MNITLDLSSLHFWTRLQVCFRILRGVPFTLTGMSAGPATEQRDPSQLQ